MPGAQKPENLSTQCQRIAERAQREPEATFTSLAHLMDANWMLTALGRTRQDGATGVDGKTLEDYAGEDALPWLTELLGRAKSGTYRAPPVRRAHIPKGTGNETRPIGVPTLEDKVLQRAVVMVLETVYEQDFLDCSYGYRPGRSAHQALAALWQQAMDMGGGYLVEVDVRRFFDTLDHGHLVTLLERRIRDGVLLRLIGKWLNAGVLEGGEVTHPETGMSQGGVISPLLANVYLHYVLDVWFEQDVKPRLKGRAFLIRYADDFVMGFACEEDARRVLEVLPKRLGKYGLTLHPDKTRLVPFVRPSALPDRSPPQVDAGPSTFDFLGFTHYWGKSQRGNWVVKRKTARERLSRALRRVSWWCRRNRHEPIAEQHRTLSQKLRGHFAYYGLTGNAGALGRFRDGVVRAWRKWLSRRRRGGSQSWDWFTGLLGRWPLPAVKVVHSVYRQ